MFRSETWFGAHFSPLVESSSPFLISKWQASGHSMGDGGLRGQLGRHWWTHWELRTTDWGREAFFRHLFSFLIAYRKIQSRCSVPENLWVIIWRLNPQGYLGVILLTLSSFKITGIWHLPKYDHFVYFKGQNICFSLCLCFHNIPKHSCIFSHIISMEIVTFQKVQMLI